jgi:hypothetical protein
MNSRLGPGMEIDGPSGPFGIALAILVGLGTMGYGVYDYTQQTSALESATTVNATIVSTGVETNQQRRGTSYSPQATFDYSYEGTNYTASNVYPGEIPRTFDSEEAARAQVEEYEQGATVTAYVPRDDPGDAFLRHESSNTPFLVTGFGLLFVLGTLYSAFRE